MKRYGVFVLLLMLSFNVFAQTDESVPDPSPDEVTIGAINVDRTGSVFSIGYRLLLGDSVRGCKVRLLISTDGGKSFAFNPSEDNVSGDIGHLVNSGDKLIRYDVTADKRHLAGKPIVFKVDIVSKDVVKPVVLASAQLSILPQLSYGGMLGFVRKVGAYVKFRSDFNSIDSSYDCMSDGTVNGGYFWASGSQKKSRLQATAGMLFHASKNVYPYVGAGYGFRKVYWEDSNGLWAQVKDYSCEGIAAEAGLMFKIGPVAFSAGVSSTVFKYVEAEIGIGVAF